MTDHDSLGANSNSTEFPLVFWVLSNLAWPQLKCSTCDVSLFATTCVELHFGMRIKYEVDRFNDRKTCLNSQVLSWQSFALIHFVVNLLKCGARLYYTCHTKAVGSLWALTNLQCCVFVWCWYILCLNSRVCGSQNKCDWLSPVVAHITTDGICIKLSFSQLYPLVLLGAF